MRVIVKPGDIFEVPLEDGMKGYIQFIAKDSTSLNFDVVRLFKTRLPASENPELNMFLNEETLGYSQTSVSAGVHLGLWKRIGRLEKDLPRDIYFRDSLDWGNYPGRTIVSKNWVVWKMNEERIYYGKLPKKFYDADIGGGFPPAQVVFRLQHGKYNMFFYPEYK